MIKGCHKARIMNRIARSCSPRGELVTMLAVYGNSHRIAPGEWVRAGWNAAINHDVLLRRGARIVFGPFRCEPMRRRAGMGA